MIERLIDSVIIIDHLNGIDKATHFIQKHDFVEIPYSL